MFRRKLTEVAVDSFTEYLQERFAKLKELDLDRDGHKDVDQVIDILGRCGNALKDTLDSTDFSKMGTGLEMIINGTQMIGTSFDAEKVRTVGVELKVGITKIGELAQLGITEMKHHKQHGGEL